MTAAPTPDLDRHTDQPEPTALRKSVGVMIAALGTGALLVLTLVIGQQQAESLARYALYQVAGLVVAALVVGGVVLATDRRPAHLRWGSLDAPASPIAALGVTTTDTWRRVGITFAVIISAVTAVFLYLAYRSELGGVPASSWLLAFALAIPLSLTNALAEELITRWAIVESMRGRWAGQAPWVSALVFGAVHWFGIPGGPVGAVMAGFLGWLLARSIQDTRGIGWAWIIHALQDVLIFTTTLALFVAGLPVPGR
ncbi:CPBP family intramembrane glutamic endopeptidase [Kribbia dieselivorans]|uniref:CPBP family intramembrane glutamic endopeptidase n=1 Tax=Kribbia dieselivorans TaxID=331526 RepID=UPI000838B244|nr:CPBP family intramembrane glutamic endopeptidase [Kribbia dieselivorans]